MARIRTIKPEFWQDEDIAGVSDKAQLLALGLLNHSDDEGYFKAHEALIRAAVFPFSEPSLNIQGMLTELSNIAYLELFDGKDGKRYGRITNFEKHQKINRPSPSKIKDLRELTERSVSPHAQLTAGKEQGTGKGTGNREGDEGSVALPTNLYEFSNEEYHPPDNLITEYGKAYPGIDVRAELRKMRVRLLGLDKTERRTSREMPRFISNWLQNAARDLANNPPKQSASFTELREAIDGL